MTKGFIRARGRTYTAYWNLVDPATGNWRQFSKGGFTTKGAAQKHLNGVLGKVSDDSWRPDKPLTVAQLLDEHWLPAQQTRGLRPATLAQYRRVADAWVKPSLGGVKVAALTPAHVTQMVDRLRTQTSSMKRDGLSPRTAQLAVGTLKAACTWAVANGMIGRNPLAGVRRPSAKSKAMSAWSIEEARTFLRETSNDPLAVVWALALTRGLRRGELSGLRWSDVDLDAGSIAITRTRVVVDGRAVDSEPKTAAGVRSVPLDPSLVALLRSRRAQQAADKLAAGPAYSEDGYVATNELGEPLHPDVISDRFDKAVSAAGLRRIRLHDTRHTAASLMLASGVPVKVVQELLGHSSPTITLSIYAHTLPGMGHEAGAALSASLLG
jgi:integrase